MADSDIEWTDKVWNVTRGCRRISAGCGGAKGEGGCYAERQAYRFSGPGQAYEGLVKLTAHGPRWTGKGKFAADKLADPFRWRKPVRVFVDSMSDLFFEEFTNEQIAAVLGVMAACPQHIFQVLTKRPRRMREWFAWTRDFALQQRELAEAPNTFRAMLDAAYEYLGKARKPELDAAWNSERGQSDQWPLSNVHVGVSVENQESADERIPELLATPAAVRFLSLEPLLGPVDLTTAFADAACKRGSLWAIVGAESGPGARPAAKPWFDSIRDQCRAAGVPLFVKQIVVDGKLRKNLDEFPPDLRIREFPR